MPEIQVLYFIQASNTCKKIWDIFSSNSRQNKMFSKQFLVLEAIESWFYDILHHIWYW